MDASVWALLAQRGPESAIIGTLVLLLAAFVRAILTGRLVPRSTYDDVRQDRDTWRKAAEMREEQVQELLATAQLTNQLLTSLKASGGEKT